MCSADRPARIHTRAFTHPFFTNSSNSWKFAYSDEDSFTIEKIYDRQ